LAFPVYAEEECKLLASAPSGTDAGMSLKMRSSLFRGAVFHRFREPSGFFR